MNNRILIIVTGHDRISAGKPTGLWFEEFAIPFSVFREHGYLLTVVTPEGGRAPIDPRSLPAEAERGAYVEAFQALENTAAVSSVNIADFDAVFLPGGHGTMFDLPVLKVGQVVGQFADAGKIVAAVCHGPAGLVKARRSNGKSVVDGLRITGFTNAEEDAAQLSTEMPFLLQDKLTALGGQFIAGGLWADHVEVDGLLVTGQNPQSSRSTALAIIRLLEKRTEVV